MIVIDKNITEQATKDAMGLVTAMDKSAEQAGLVFHYLQRFMAGRKTGLGTKRQKDAIEAFTVLVMPRAIGNPNGRFAEILGKRGFLVPEITKLFYVDPKTAAEWQNPEETAE
jgi:hypothetical protein